MDDPQAVESEIEELQKQLEDLRQGVDELKQYGGHLYNELLKEVAAYYADQEQKLKEWAERDKEFAKKEFESEVFIDESSIQEQKDQCIERGFQFLRYKFDRLLQTLPEASDYFLTKKTQFLEEIFKINGIGDDNMNDVLVDLDTHGPESCPVLPMTSVTYSVVKNTLLVGDKKCGPGSKAFLNLSSMPPMHGIIRGITKQKIDFVPDGQDPITIPLTSLNYHLASITFK